MEPGRPSPSVEACLDSAGVVKTMARYDRGEAIFRQGDVADHVLYVQMGGVKLSVLSPTGREAVVAVLGPGDFFGEACLGGQRVRVNGASAITPTVILRVGKRVMSRLLQSQPTMSDQFISQMLTRNLRIEDDLVVQLLDSHERRLARTLLGFARYGTLETPLRVVPIPTDATLAKMVGTTSARVALLLKSFKRRGFIKRARSGSVIVDRSLLSLVLRD